MNLSRRQMLSTLACAAVAPGGELRYQTPAPSSGTGSATQAVGAWRAQFPALAQKINGHPLAYLDNAATTSRPRAVIDALVGFYERDNANPSAAMHTLARRAAAAQDAARAAVARFVNAPGAEDVIFTRGTTEGINLVAATWGVSRVRAGDNIVVTLAEHASNLFPWQRLAAQTGARLTVVGVLDDGQLRMDEFERALTSRTRLVAVTHVSNVLGIVYPVAEICALARRRGAAVLVDAAQSAPHVPIDVQQLGCDFLAFSSHKMLGPMGAGVLWVRSDRWAEMPAYHVGSNMAHGADISTATAEPGALRFQAGTPNVSGAVGFARALEVLDGFGLSAVGAHDRALTAHALERLRTVRKLRLLGSYGPEGRVPVFSFTIEGVPVPAIVKASDSAGIAIRGGDLAALPLLQRFGVTAAARASAYLYNTTYEIDRLVEVLKAL
jgi:cysteine desulfurase / selenocysteine lyase